MNSTVLCLDYYLQTLLDMYTSSGPQSPTFLLALNTLADHVSTTPLLGSIPLEHYSTFTILGQLVEDAESPSTTTRTALILLSVLCRSPGLVDISEHQFQLTEPLIHKLFLHFVHGDEQHAILIILTQAIASDEAFMNIVTLFSPSMLRTVYIDNVLLRPLVAELLCSYAYSTSLFDDNGLLDTLISLVEWTSQSKDTSSPSKMIAATRCALLHYLSQTELHIPSSSKLPQYWTEGSLRELIHWGFREGTAQAKEDCLLLVCSLGTQVHLDVKIIQQCCIDLDQYPVHLIFLYLTLFSRLLQIHHFNTQHLELIFVFSDFSAVLQALLSISEESCPREEQVLWHVIHRHCREIIDFSH